MPKKRTVVAKPVVAEEAYPGTILNGDYLNFKKSVLVAVDPGVHGAIAIRHQDGTITLHDAPITIKERKVTSGKRKGKIAKTSSYDLPALAALIPCGSEFIIENVSRMPNDSAHASSLLMEGKGVYLGMAAAKGMNIQMVTPAVWKKKIGLPKGADKEVSIKWATSFYPKLAEYMALKKHEGRAEALLILHYLIKYILKEE